MLKLALVLLPIGMTFGVGTWALIRGRGGFRGLVLSMLMGTVNASIGALGTQTLLPDASGGQLALGAAMVALIGSVVEAVGWGPRPRSQGRRAAKSATP